MSSEQMAEMAAAQRRARGRRAQASYRQRLATRDRELADERQRVKDAIEKVTACVKGDERPELLESISQLAEVAGIIVLEAERFEGPLPEARARAPPPSPVSVEEPNKTGALVTLPPSQEDEEMILLDYSPPPPKTSSTSFWLDPLHFMRVPLPPGDIVPYLGARSDTLAGRFFWSGMDHFQVGCSQVHWHNSHGIIHGGLAHSKATQEIAVPFIRAMVSARLEYRRTGAVSAPLAAAAEPDLGLVMHRRVLDEYLSKGEDPSMWLSCQGVADHLKKTMSSAKYSSLDLASRAAKVDKRAATLFEGLVCKMCDTSVCFGDGPRWHVGVVEELFLKRF